jgi:hypothetical protein
MPHIGSSIKQSAFSMIRGAKIGIHQCYSNRSSNKIMHSPLSFHLTLSLRVVILSCVISFVLQNCNYHSLHRLTNH